MGIKNKIKKKDICKLTVYTDRTYVASHKFVCVAYIRNNNKQQLSSISRSISRINTMHSLHTTTPYAKDVTYS